MRQTLHIFRKDFRALGFDIAVILALMALFAYADSHSSAEFNQQTRMFNATAEILSLLLPVSWLYLIARLVHAEPLAGDRQFWLTRPYKWTSLLAAKVLFILATISVPKAIVDAIIVTAHHLPLSRLLPGFACREVLIALVMLLSLAALATVTSDLAQTFLIVVVSIVVTLAEGSSGINPNLGNLEWLVLTLSWSIGFLAATIMILLQYSRRRTTVSRAIGIVAIVIALLPIPWSLAFAIQAHLSKTAIGNAVQIKLDSARQMHYGRIGYGDAALQIPIAIAGMEVGSALRSERIDLVVSNRKVSLHPRNATLIHDRDDYWIAIPRSQSVDPAAGPVSVRGELFLTLFGNPHRTLLPLGTDPVPVPQVGNCYVEQGTYPVPFCTSAFRWPPLLIEVRMGADSSEFRDRPYSPLPANLGISPVTSWPALPNRSTAGLPQEAPAILTAEEPLAHFRREFTAVISGEAR